MLLAGLEVFLRILQPAFLAPFDLVRQNPAGLPYFRTMEKEGSSFLVPSRYYLPWGHDFLLREPKYQGVFRAFSLGGSATVGWPYGREDSFTALLQAMLSQTDQTGTFELVNSGQLGISSRDVLDIGEQVLEAGPDLLVVYAGNNEFLDNRQEKFKLELPRWALLGRYWVLRLKTVQLFQYLHGFVGGDEDPVEKPVFRRDMATIVNQQASNTWDREHRWAIHQGFRANLEKLVGSARARGVNVVLCTVAVNLKDYEPAGSYHRLGLSSADLERFDRLVEAGKSAYAGGDLSAARDRFREAVDIDPKHAEANYWLGRVLVELGEQGQAIGFFQAAVDNDTVLNRAGSAINAIIRETAEKYGVALADVEKAVRDAAPGHIPGYESFFDNVHPRIETTALIARTILETMAQHGWADDPGPAARSVSGSEELMPAKLLAQAYYQAAGNNAYMGRLDRALIQANRALELDPGHAKAREIKADLLQLLAMRKGDPGLPWTGMEFARSLGDNPLVLP